jgi:DNA-binding response OmpR family regulator
VYPILRKGRITLPNKPSYEQLQGFRVECAADGDEALKIFKTNPSIFDLILTDQSMPKLSGAELTKEIRNTKSNIPIILSTGKLGAEDQKEFKDIGITDFIQKPWTADELITRVREIDLK